MMNQANGSVTVTPVSERRPADGFFVGFEGFFASAVFLGAFGAARATCLPFFCAGLGSSAANNE